MIRSVVAQSFANTSVQKTILWSKTHYSISNAACGERSQTKNGKEIFPSKWNNVSYLITNL
jgi:hypothetical protein